MTHCNDCGRRILGVAGDPVHHLSRRGVLCTECLRKPGREAEKVTPERGAETRGEAAKARWEAMTPEQQAARVAKMRAGRAARTDASDADADGAVA